MFYASGFELASRLNENGDVRATIDNQRVAAIRIRIDQPDTVFFVKPKTGLRIDLLFDFPIPAATLAENATPREIRSMSFTSLPKLICSASNKSPTPPARPRATLKTSRSSKRAWRVPRSRFEISVGPAQPAPPVHSVLGVEAMRGELAIERGAADTQQACGLRSVAAQRGEARPAAARARCRPRRRRSGCISAMISVGRLLEAQSRSRCPSIACSIAPFSSRTFPGHG